MNTKLLIAYVSIWYAVSISVCVAISYTQNGKWLWFLLIPAFMSLRVENEESKSKDE